MIRPTSDFHYKKAILKEQKQKGMITENQFFIFMEWTVDRYYRFDSFWVNKQHKGENPVKYTTAELWELYQKTYLGKKG